MATTAKCIEYQINQSYRTLVSDDADTPKKTGLLTGVLARVRRWRQLSRQRRELAQLSDEILKDIGLSRADALREAGRRFWDDPASRR